MLIDLPTLIMKFRIGRIGLSADIAKAFLSVKLQEGDRRYVRFLWYKDNNPNNPIVPYQHNTVIFGSTASPFMLAAVLNKHLQLSDSWIAADMINRFYVDNLLTSVMSEVDALSYYQSSNKILNDAGFHLRQWASNSKQVSDAAKIDEIQYPTEEVSVLGMSWNTRTDLISLSQAQLVTTTTNTKRSVVSQTASVYDPLGLAGPVIALAKIFINKLWLTGKDWDDRLSTEETGEWDVIRSNLRQTNEIIVPRWLGMDTNQKVHFMVFSDAAPNVAIGCVVYAKQGGNVQIIGSKNKVVSKNKSGWTVPKLELEAMTMAVKYVNTVIDAYSSQFKTIEVRYFTDSTIALCWLKSNKDLTQFVKNRVEKIKNGSLVDRWTHMASEHNPADIISRGMSFDNLRRSMWFTGPQWMLASLAPPVANEDIGVTILAAATEYENEFITRETQDSDKQGIHNIIDVNEFTDWTKLIKVIALVKRAFKKGLTHKRCQLSAADMYSAEMTLILSHQRRTYPDVFRYIETNKGKCPALVRQLGIEKDKHGGYLRCVGRLKNAKRVNPLLNSHNSYLATLIIRQSHENVLHYGVGMTICDVRKRYWISAVRFVAKKNLHRCVTCKKLYGKPYTAPDPPPLPDFRLTNFRPFSATAMDFTGHLNVRKGVTEVGKCYICLYTCCTTHLEVVNDLSVDSYIRSFRRFCTAYSTPNILYSDNAKTFVAGEAEIKRLFEIANSSQSQNHYAEKRVAFKYAPVQAPWMAGVHERCVGTIKRAVKKTLKNALVTIEELQTLVKEIQAIVNNRPLTYVEEKIDELKPVTPNSLIYGRDVELIPNEEIGESVIFDADYLNNTSITLQKMAFYRAKLITDFQNRFKSEYLAVLRERHRTEIKKRHHKKATIKNGDVVVINDKDTPRHKWKLGIITETLESSDGGIRAARVKTINGTTCRAVSKSYPLEFSVDVIVKQNKSAADKPKPLKRPCREAAHKARAKIAQLATDSDHDSDST
ncbi:uncharacterized protein LOC141904377 [Tubulanus polymorphus]|uniref:uncharacterized protein LOC141904377 n=1 Tax=Tubulanus polymorphus TaxID=672921 RepID=UPI003DA53BE3